MYSSKDDSGKQKKKSRGGSSRSHGNSSKAIKVFWCIYVGLLLLGGGGLALTFYVLSRNIPSVAQLEKDIEGNQQATIVYDAGGAELGRYFVENRSNCRYADLSPTIVHALIATEDARFYEHSGVDLRALGRVLKGVVFRSSGGGGSTITQQLAKNLYPRKKGVSIVKSKLQEWIVAIMLEREYSKDEILTLYLNTVDFSHQAMGIETAAHRYFNTTPDKLTVEQSALLVGMLKAPGTYNPRVNPDKARGRRNVVIGQMKKYDFLTKEECEKYQALPLKLDFMQEDHTTGQATYFREYVRTYLQDFFNQPEHFKPNGTPYNIYTDGLKIYTTIDSTMQAYAERAVYEHLYVYDSAHKVSSLQARFNKEQTTNSNKPFYNLSKEQTQNILNSAKRCSARYRAAVAANKTAEEIEKEFNTKVKMSVPCQDGSGARKEVVMTPYDSIRYMKSFLQCGFMAMESTTGRIKAYVGGVNYEVSQFDHVMLSQRQVGSTFKPYVYSSAMDNSNGELTPCSYVPNEVVSVPRPDGNVWTVGRQYTGASSLTLKEALARSLNNVSARLITTPEYGGPAAVVDLVRKMGIKSKIDTVPAISLGAVDLTLYEQVGAINCFPNQGVYVEPYFIVKICDRDGNIIFEKHPEKHDAMSQLLAFQTASMMRGVVEHGTGARLKSAAWYNLDFPVAGKTGTTNNHSDAWFVGYTPMLTCGVWVGCDDRSAHFRSMDNGQGGRAAMPIFGRFMHYCYTDPNLPYREIAKKKDYNDPRYTFPAPEGYSVNEYGCVTEDAATTSAGTIEF